MRKIKRERKRERKELKKIVLLSIQDYQVVIAQWLARCLATGEVQGSNPGKGVNLLVSNLKRKLINSNLKAIMVWVYELTGQV